MTVVKTEMHCERSSGGLTVTSLWGEAEREREREVPCKLRLRRKDDDLSVEGR